MHANLLAERADLVTLAPEEREALEQGIATALRYAKQEAESLDPTAEEHEVIRSLEGLCAAFPEVLPRAAVVRLHRSVARLGRLESLQAPEFTLAKEASIMHGAMEPATGPIEEPGPELDDDYEINSTFFEGLDQCVILEAGADGARDLGLGYSAALPRVLGVDGMDLYDVDDAWRETAAPDHPWARYPIVPRGRFGRMRADRVVPGALENTGPIGWAAGHHLAKLSDDLRALAAGEAHARAELLAVADRVADVASRNQAVIGFIEFRPPEAAGQPRWLVEIDHHDSGVLRRS